MDPLTQAVLGAGVGQALFHRRLGRSAIVVGAMAAAWPDLDVVVKFDQWSGWIYHRGLTHSLLIVPLAGPATGWLAWQVAQWRARRGGPDPGKFTDWLWLCTLALLTHSLLDASTAYGTQLLAPFSDQRFAIDAIPVIDPVYTVPIVLAVLVGLWSGGRWRLARRTAMAALIFSNGFLLYTWWLNGQAADEARRQLAAEGVTDAQVHAYPTIFQSFLRRIIVYRPDEIRVGFLTMLDPGPIQWFRAEPPTDPQVADFRSRWEADLLDWFAMGKTFYRSYRDEDRVVVEATDLRYGATGTTLWGIWGIRTVYDAAGRIVVPPTRFSNRPSVNMANLSYLKRLMLDQSAVAAPAPQ